MRQKLREVVGDGVAIEEVLEVPPVRLKTLPGFADFQYNFVASAQDRRQAQLRTMAAWDRGKGAAGNMALPTLVRADKSLDVENVLRLLKMRNNRRVLLRE